MNTTLLFIIKIIDLIFKMYLEIRKTELKLKMKNITLVVTLIHADITLKYKEITQGNLF